MLGLFALAFAGCSSGGTKDDGALTLILVGPNDSNPLTGASSLLLQVFANNPALGGLKPIDSQAFPLPGNIVMDHTPYGTGLYFLVTTLDGSGNILLSGVDGPQDIVQGLHVDVTVIMQAPV